MTRAPKPGVGQRLEQALVRSLPMRWDSANHRSCHVDTSRVTADFDGRRAEGGGAEGILLGRPLRHVGGWRQGSDRVSFPVAAAIPSGDRRQPRFQARRPSGREYRTRLEDSAGPLQRGQSSHGGYGQPTLQSELDLTLPNQPSPKSRGLNNDDRRLGPGPSRIVITSSQ